MQDKEERTKLGKEPERMRNQAELCYPQNNKRPSSFPQKLERTLQKPQGPPERGSLSRKANDQRQMMVSQALTLSLLDSADRKPLHAAQKAALD